jgi:hypothetical protein
MDIKVNSHGCGEQCQHKSKKKILSHPSSFQGFPIILYHLAGENGLLTYIFRMDFNELFF